MEKKNKNTDFEKNSSFQLSECPHTLEEKYLCQTSWSLFEHYVEDRLCTNCSDIFGRKKKGLHKLGQSSTQRQWRVNMEEIWSNNLKFKKKSEEYSGKKKTFNSWNVTLWWKRGLQYGLKD